MDKNFYKDLIQNAPYGYAYHKIITNNSGKAKNYQFLEVNKTFEDLTGLKSENIIGKNVTEVIPEIINDGFNWIEFYGEIALSGKEKRFKQHSQALNKHYEAHAYSPKKGYFITLFTELSKVHETTPEEQRKRLELAMDAGEHGFWEWNLDNNNAFFSPQYFNMLGYTPGELPETLETWNNLLHPDDEKTVSEYIMSKVQKGEPYTTEFRLRCKDGTYKWIQGKGKMYNFDNNGKPHLAVGVHIDITKRKKYEEALEKQEERFRLMVKNTSDIIVILDKEGNQKYVSEPAERITGYTANELTGKSFAEIIHPDDINRVQELWNELLKHPNKTSRATYRHIHKTKGWVLLEAIGQNFLEEPALNAVVTGVRDISERDEQNKKLRKRDELLEKLSMQIPGVIYQYQYYPDGRNFFPFASEKIYEIYEVTPEEVKESAQKVLDRLHPDDASGVMNSIVKSYETLETWRHDYRVVLPKKGTRWLRGAANPQKMNDGSVLWHGFITDITEIKETEEKLLSQAGLINSLFASIPDIVSYKDKSGKYLSCNRHFCEFIDKEQSKIIGKYDKDLFDKNIANLYTQTDKAIISTLKPKHNEEYHRFKNKTILLDTIKTPVFNDTGEVIGVLSISRDITERKQIEDELRKTQEQYKLAIAGTNDGIWDWNIKTNILFLSNRWKEMLGYKDNELQNNFNTFTSLIYKEDVSKVNNYVKKYLNGEVKKYEIEFRMNHKDGSTRWILAKGEALRDSKGIPYRMAGSHSDITNRKLAEQELKYRNELQNILMNISTKYINISLDEIEYNINKSLEEIGTFVTADRAYIFDYNWHKNNCSNTYEWCAKGVIPQIDNLQNLSLDAIPEWTKAHKKGDYMYVKDVLKLDKNDSLRKILEPQDIKSMIAIPIMAKENCEGFIGFDSVKSNHEYSEKEIVLLELFAQMLVNIQNRQKTDISLQEFAVELQEKNIALDEALEKAKDASKAKSEFLANMSHEIRTPLNSVIGFSDLMKRTELSSTQIEYINNVNNSARSLLNIINDILDFSKIEAGKLDLDIIKTDIDEIMYEAAEMIKLAASQKDLELLVDIQNNIPKKIQADPIRLKQILINLLGNAVKFTNKGEVILKLEANKTAQNKHKFKFSVKDTGIGITEEQRSKLFKAFSQADTSTTRKFGGTGLGLIISDLLAKKMNSKIEFISTPGKGTNFFFEIELDTDNEIKSQIEIPNRTNNVLIVDDNEKNCRILSDVLSYRNIDSTSAENGFLALKTIEESDFDILLVDYNMPILSGIETIEILNQRFYEKGIKPKIILMYDAFIENEIKNKADNLKVDYFISKPVNTNELLTYLSKINNNSNTENNKEENSITKVNADAIKIMVAEDHPTNMLLAKTIIEIANPNAKIIEAKSGLEAVDKYKLEAPDIILMDIQMPILDGIAATKRIREFEKTHKKNTIPIYALTAGVLKNAKENAINAGMTGFITKPIELAELEEILALLVNQNKIYKSIPKKEPNHSCADNEHFECKKLLMKLHGKTKALKKMIQLTLKQTSERINTLQDLLNKKDFKTIEGSAHAIKGSSYTMMFTIMAKIAEKLETYAREQNPEKTESGIKELMKEWEIIKEIIS